MSAQLREIQRLRQHIAELEESRREYSLVLNFLVWSSQDKKFFVEKSKVKQMMEEQHKQLRPIKSEIDALGNMTWEFAGEPPQEPSRIIKLNGE